MAEMDGQSDQELLAAYLANRDVPCAVCGQNIRSLKSNRCPECGSSLFLSVSVEVRNLGWWTASLCLAVFATLVFCLCFAVLYLVTGLGGDYLDLDWEEWVTLLTAAVLAFLNAGIVAYLVSHRRRWSCWAPWRRRFLTLLLGALIIGQIVAYTFLLEWVDW